MVSPLPSLTVSHREMWPFLMGRDPDGDGNWGKMRAATILSLKRHEPLRVVFQVALAILAAAMLVGTADPVRLGLWVGGIVLFGVWTWLHFLRLAVWSRPTADRADFREFHRHALIGALLWAHGYFIGATGEAPSPETIRTVWSAGLLLMAVTTLTLHPVPLAGIIFNVGTSLAAACAYLLIGSWEMAGVAVLAGLLFSLITIQFSLAQVMVRVAQSNLQEKSETVSLLLREFEETSADWLWQTDGNRRLSTVSPRLAHALGSTPGELEGQPLLQALTGPLWSTGNFDPSLRDLADRMQRRESFSNVTVPVQIGDALFWWELSASPRVDERGKFQGFRGVGSDVTQKRVSDEKIEKMARYDGLTGLPNRTHLNETLADALTDAMRTGTLCALLMIDLDRFKAVNDTLGHPVGDKLLAQVSARLKALMDPKWLCGRLGGDEFAVVMRQIIGAQDPEDLARHIIASVCRPYEVDNHTLYVGASVGFAIGPSEGAAVETLTRNADLALYKSKELGGNHVSRYTPSMHAQAEERRLIEIELRNALENGEFELHYQPVVSCTDAVLEGFEALLRWRNPKLGVVSPAKFIPVAEDARLIPSIGEWALRQACHEAMRWPTNLKVAVNVSAEQLTDHSFASLVVSALAQSGLPARRLEIEVTESVFMRDDSAAAAILERLLGLGVRLSLDDFGTGYSSLGYLRKTKFSTIKIDRSFVVGAARAVPESIAIIRAVVALADSLSMKTTAEGVETPEEVETIRRLGCSSIQGYFYGKPAPASEVMRLFDNFGRKRLAEGS